MRAYEVAARVTPEGRLELPEDLLKLLLANALVRITLLVNEPADAEEQAAWLRLTAGQFVAGYSVAADSVYDCI